MGFSIRKRTKGKGSWLNLSYSKNGLNASHTMRFGNVTVNMGKKLRTTVNFGNGVRYVTSSGSDKNKNASNYIPYDDVAAFANGKSTYQYDDSWSSENIAMMSGIFWCLVGFVFTYIFSSILLTILAVNVAHVLTLRWKLPDYPQEKLAYFIPTILMITPIGWVYFLLMLLFV